MEELKCLHRALTSTTKHLSNELECWLSPMHFTLTSVPDHTNAINSQSHTVQWNLVQSLPSRVVVAVKLDQIWNVIFSKYMCDGLVSTNLFSGLLRPIGISCHWTSTTFMYPKILNLFPVFFPKSDVWHQWIESKPVHKAVAQSFLVSEVF